MENQGFPQIYIEKDMMRYLKKIKRSLINYNKNNVTWMRVTDNR